jgi:hypothetical protein
MSPTPQVKIALGIKIILRKIKGWEGTIEGKLNEKIKGCTVSKRCKTKDLLKKKYERWHLGE